VFSILIVEEKTDDRDYILKSIDWESLDLRVCAAASSGAAGRRYCMRYKPDIMLAAISVSVMNELEMLVDNFQTSYKPVFILVGSLGDFKNTSSAINYYVLQFLPKPVDAGMLTQTLLRATCVADKHKFRKLDRNMLLEKLKCTYPIVLSDLYRDIIHAFIDGDALIERSSCLHISFYGRRRVAAMRYDNNYLLQDRELSMNISLLVYLIKEKADELFTLEQSYVTADNHTLVLIPWDWNNNEEFLRFTDKLNKLREIILEITGLSLIIGVSKPVNTLADLPMAFKSAFNAISSQSGAETGQIIFVENVESLSEHQADFTEVKKIIYETVNGGDVIYIDNVILSLFERESSVTYAKEMSYMIVLSLHMFLADSGINFEDVFGDKFSVWNELADFDKIPHIRMWLKNLICLVIGYINSRKGNNRHFAIVTQIKSIIDKDYASIENITQIADLIYISPGYAKHLFKLETKMTIGEYLLMRRMEVAKKLLADPLAVIYEVSERVGYISKSYFGSIFKKYTGMPPKEYQRKFCRLK